MRDEAATNRTGRRGAGFLGAALCARLLEAGRDVVCLDDFSAGTMAAMAPFLDHPRVRLMRGDVRDPPDIPAAEIFNLACPADPAWWPRDPDFVVTTAFIGTARLLALARLVLRLAGSTAPVVAAPGRAQDPRRRRPDLARAPGLLGFSPRVGLDEGLRRLLVARRAAPARMAAMP